MTLRIVSPRGWQLDFQAGFNGQFDADNSLDNIGWDGVYALFLSRTRHGSQRLRGTGLERRRLRRRRAHLGPAAPLADRAPVPRRPVPIGEFFQTDESWLALGAWLDL